MTNQEILDYLKSTGLYDSRIDLLHIKDMLNDNKSKRIIFGRFL